MFRLTPREFSFIGSCLEGFVYGLYSGIFAIYLQYCASNKETSKTQNVIFYSTCALYVLSIALFVSDNISTLFCSYLTKPMETLLHIDFIQITSFACCDFIAQFILIYRCWIVWGRNNRVVIIPSILAFAFLGTWLACINSPPVLATSDSYALSISGLAMSLTVNALVTGLIVFRIFKVFQATSSTTGGNKLRPVIFILIESGMALISIQLARLVVTIVMTGAACAALSIIIGIHEMLTGITPTLILVRTSMVLSFHDEKSMEEFAIGSLRFASNHTNSVPETGSIGIIDQDRRDADDIGIQQSNEIEVVER